MSIGGQGQDDGSGDQDMITEINVTPFVDVVLVLLILFMLAAPVVYQSGVRIKLPSIVTAGRIKHVTLRFAITPSGDVMVDREKLSGTTASVIEDVVKKALSHDPHADAILSADAAVTHGKVLEVIDAIRKAGIREIALGADKKTN